jgi:hypothetical protein
LLLGLTHCYGTLYVAILLAIDAVERRFNRSRLPGIGLFSLLLIWPLYQKLFGSLEMQAESNQLVEMSNQLVEMLLFVSTLNNFLMGNLPVILVSPQPAYLFATAVFAALVDAAWRSPQSHRAGASQTTPPRFKALSWNGPESQAVSLVQLPWCRTSASSSPIAVSIFACLLGWFTCSQRRSTSPSPSRRPTTSSSACQPLSSCSMPSSTKRSKVGSESGLPFLSQEVW